MERKERTNEELINQIELLKQCLKFYADSSNYKGVDGFPLITLDNGNQARFTLEKLKEYDKFHDDLIKDSREILKQYGQEGFDDQETMNKLVEINKIINKYNDK